MRIGHVFNARELCWFLLLLAFTRTSCHIIENRQETTSCSSGSYETPIGLSFSVFCSENIEGHKIGQSSGSNITDCMDQCADLIPPLGTAACAAVTFTGSDGLCRFRDGNVTSVDITYGEVGVDAGFAAAEQLAPMGGSCPFPDYSFQNTSNGMVFQIRCGYQSYGRTYDGIDDPYYRPHHTSSLEECMAWCSKGTPLCYGVTWGSDLIRGYRNCLPKNRNISDNFIKSEFMMHTAQVMFSVNSTCDPGILVTDNGKSFRRACEQRMDGNLIGQIHMPDFDACVEYCSGYANGSAECSLALYQPTAVDGFENCYLMDSSSSAGFSASGYQFAMLESSSADAATSVTRSTVTASATTTSPATPNAPGKGHSSKLWIIGAVLGPLAAVALLAGSIIVWLRRRARNPPKKASHPAKVDGILARSTGALRHEKDELDTAPQLRPELHGTDAPRRIPEMM